MAWRRANASEEEVNRAGSRRAGLRKRVESHQDGYSTGGRLKQRESG
ncbi:hypothetical protein LNQ03_08330 [Klebsiella pneumoniae subsp. pneumoniae]|nr:hypothetical protein [Klebsiella pneumoniae subsp. pneumoniae]